MPEEKSFFQENTEQNKNIPVEVPKKRGGKWGLAVIILAIFLATAGIYAYNRWFKNGQLAGQQEVALAIAKNDIAKDFVNQEKKLHSDAIPPQSLKDRLADPINKSLEAIKNNKPSEERFKDLRDDYLNVASDYSILGDYAKAEEYYQKILEQWPDDYKANMNLGDLDIMMGQYQAAGYKFMDTVEKYPKDYRIYAKLVDLYINYSIALDNLAKADKIYEVGTKKVDYKISLYKDYAYFLENYLKDYNRAIEVTREYEKIAGSQENVEIERLQKMIGE
jgi:tetratricopeptide (TPR) repeat protein